ncbi:MAG: hypothetical protein JWQ03_339, partial [Variovorax sp.]|nr:hypothetical protein [Variovorax sp.]
MPVQEPVPELVPVQERALVPEPERAP